MKVREEAVERLGVILVNVLSEPWSWLHSVEDFEKRYGQYRGGLSPAQLSEILVQVGAISEVDVRLTCMRRLLDDGADPTVRMDSLTPLHTMFGAYEQDIPGEAEMLARLLAAGVDLNARERRGDTALSMLVGRYAIPEADLQPIYDVAFPWGEQPGPDGRPRGLDISVGPHNRRPVFRAWEAKFPFDRSKEK